jgi:hypothetical protein
MQTLERIQLRHEIDETVNCICGVLTKAEHDPHFPQTAEQELQAQLYDAWQAQLRAAAGEIFRMVGPQSGSSVVPEILHSFEKHLSGPAITSHLHPKAAIKAAITKGQEHGQAMYDHAKSRMRKDDTFGLLFGLTEQHALVAIEEQIMLSAGGLWNEELSDSIKTAVDEFFTGDIKNENLVTKIETLVNTRLSIEGKSLARSYFDLLANNYVVRARNVGSIYQAQDLGVTHYTIEGVLDHRTSPMCRALIKSKKVFTMAGAKGRMDNILRARSSEELKSAAPWMKDASDAKSYNDPIPPLHPFCRDWMNYIL